MIYFFLAMLLIWQSVIRQVGKGGHARHQVSSHRDALQGPGRQEIGTAIREPISRSTVDDVWSSQSHVRILKIT